MILYKKEIPVINNIINNTFSKSLNLKNIYIAGGFINSLYLSYLKVKDNLDGRSILLNLDSRKVLNKIPFGKSKSFSFGDIDIWKKDCNNPVIINDENLLLQRTSEWCDTYAWLCQPENFKFFVDFQIMKTPKSTVSDLISFFDINCCCIGWQDNYIFYNISYHQFLENKKIAFNAIPSYEKEEDVIYYLSRLVKYIEKSNYSFDKDIGNYLVEEYYKIRDFNLDEHDVTYCNNSTYGIIRSTKNQYKEYRHKIIVCLRNIITLGKVHPSLFAYLINDKNFSFAIETFLYNKNAEGSSDRELPF